MGNFTEKMVIQALALIGGYPTFATSDDEMRGFFKKLRPIDSGMELIRLGPNGDGGYLVPNDLTGVEACFSPGIADCSEFEKDCAERGMDVYLADKSVDAPAAKHPRFRFIKKHIGAVPDSDFMTMDEWVEAAIPKSDSDLMLQMDVEGHEYQAILSTSPSLLRRFRIMVVEFHDLPRMWSLPYYSIASVVFAKILQNHVCVHMHPNSCCGSIMRKGVEIPRIMEITFLRRDRIKKASFATKFPHPLDSKNSVEAPDLPLPKCWYSD